jgi:hypothetical protein
MQILDLSDLSDGSPFCLKRVITDSQKYYAEIQPLQSTFRIQLSRSDYKKILEAFQAGKIVKLYPFEGKISEDNEFIEGKYKIEIV